MTTAFSVTWDYRCPFAYVATDHVLTALRAGAPWEVTWVPFSLSQVHVAEGEIDVWDDPAKRDGLRAMESAIVVRDRFPEQWPAVHEGLFAARHSQGLDLRDQEIIDSVLAQNGVDPDAVAAEVRTEGPLAEFCKAHTEMVESHQVFGVPTFIVDGAAVFVRLMHRPADDAELARRTIDRVLDMITGWPELNEFKHTSLAR